MTENSVGSIRTKDSTKSTQAENQIDSN